MNELLFDPDDPRLTAYALGELTDAAERAHVERLLAHSPEARAALEETRALTAALVAEYDAERAAAEQEAAAEPAGSAPNVIAMPVEGRSRGVRSWVGPLLKMAAVLLALGVLGSLFRPVFSTVQVKVPKPVVQATVERAPDAPVTAEVQKALAQNTTEPLPPPPTAEAEKPALLASLPSSAPARPAPAATPASMSMPPAAPAGPEPLVALNQPKDGKRDETSTSQLDAHIQAVQTAQDTLQHPLTLKSGPSPFVMRRSFPDRDRETLVDPLSNEPPPPSIALAKPAAPVRPTADDAAQRLLAARRTGKDTSRSKEFEGSIHYGSPIVAATPAPSPMAALAGNKGESVDKSFYFDAASKSKAAPADASSVGGSVPVLGDVPVVGRLFREEEKPKSNADAGAFNTAAYDHLVENGFLAVKDNPLSTFSVDVDTASYANVRRFIESGSLPPKDAVRVEELLNYFPYADAPPAPGDERPFAIHLEGAACPWAPDHRLVRIGIKGREMARDKRPPSNLVFLLDVSGSMSPPERLPLIKESLRQLVDQLTEGDRVAIVVYAGASGLALPSTGGDHKEDILRALGRLQAGGSTNGASGIQLAYKVAQEHFIKGGVNRVILATDGDFNVGVTNQGDLVRLIEQKAKSGVFLSVLGVGTDNYKDSTMQKLADRGNGNYAYIDRLAEGKKVLVEQMSGTLVTIAKDVKIQVEFNPAAVSAYRLIGYEKRMLRKEDFNDDRIDAGEIGAGHSVTALYEIVPAGTPTPQAAPAVDALKYQPALAAGDAKEERKPETPTTAAPSKPEDSSKPADASELLTVKMRHKAPDADKSERSFEEPLSARAASGEFANASPDFKFAAAVASFGLALRDSPHKGNATLGAALELAQEGKGEDPGGHRAGFIEMVRRAQSLSGAR
jgi:Ca-activated chloride channel family protein